MGRNSGERLWLGTYHILPEKPRRCLWQGRGFGYDFDYRSFKKMIINTNLKTSDSLYLKVGVHKDYLNKLGGLCKDPISSISP